MWVLIVYFSTMSDGIGQAEDRHPTREAAMRAKAEHEGMGRKVEGPFRGTVDRSQGRQPSLF